MELVRSLFDQFHGEWGCKTLSATVIFFEKRIITSRISIKPAAGTGKWTRLIPPVKKLMAVEPNEEMRAKFKDVLPHLEIFPGTSTSIPFPDNTFDLITVAQVFSLPFLFLF